MLSIIFGTAAVLILVFLAIGFSRSSDRRASQVVSDIGKDQSLVFFKTFAWLDEQKQEWIVPIHAWVHEPESSRVRIAAFRRILASKYGLLPEKSEEQNFLLRTNLLISDNERGRKLVIKIGERLFTTPKSVSNGHIKTQIKIPASEVGGRAELVYRAVLHHGDAREFIGESMLVPSQGLSVISDIDDTVKVTEVTDRKRLIANTFYKDFSAVAGMADLYRDWALRDVSFHFVSSSPWYLYSPLQAFLKNAGFPSATLTLKAFRFRDRSLLQLFEKGTVTKPPALRMVIKAYPQRRFILVGDSGEEDAEVYAQLAEQYPEQIHRIFIRNIDGSEETQARIAKILADLPQAQWSVFDDPSSLRLD